jgi:GNAT superfamily N-acetyltransferase
MTLAVRTAGTDDADLGAIAAIVNLSAPEDTTSIDDMRWSDDTYPGGARFLAERDGRPIGAATTGRIFIYPAAFPAWWATINVRPAARRRGAGSLLLDAVARAADGAGKGELHVPTSADRPESIAFLEHRGFVEHERSRAVRLELAGRPEPAFDVPDGVELVDLASRPDLVAGVFAVATATFMDIPGEDGPLATGDLAEFRARDVDRPGIPAGGFAIAIERATGAVVGYASLLMKAGSPGVAYHDMTAVVRSWRGRGLATALKQRTIGWAIRNGLTALETGNDEDNLPMQAVNRRLGYLPLPDLLTMRGSVDRAMMAR